MSTLVQQPQGGENALTRGAQSVRHALFVLSLTTGVFAASLLWRPSDLPGIVLCPFRALTGYPCPGCGMTRAFCAIGHGEFARAVGYNALSPAVFLTVLVMWARSLATVAGLEGARAALERLTPGAHAAKFLLVLVLVWWLARLGGNF